MSFLELWSEMQELQERVLQAYEAEVQVDVKRAEKKKVKSADTLTLPSSSLRAPGTVAKTKSVSINVDPDQTSDAAKALSAKDSSTLPVPDSSRVISLTSSDQYSPSLESSPSGSPAANVITPRSAKTSKKLLKQAREATVNIEHAVEQDSLNGALQLREQWDLPQEKLRELKRIQRRMSVGSMCSIKSAVKRQYLRTEKEEDIRCFILKPSSKKRLIYDCIAMVLILFEISFSPLHLYNLSPEFRRTADVLQWIATCFWLVDIPVNFVTAVYVNDTLRYHLCDIARVYLRGWFLFDAAMLVPDFVALFLVESNDGPAGVLRIARTRRLFRLLRFVQIIRLWNIVQSFGSLEAHISFLRTEFGSLVQPTCNVLVILMLSAHVLGSAWFAVGYVDGGWVTVAGLHEEELGKQYTTSLEWAVSHMPPSALRATVALNTPAERWLGISATAGALLCSTIFVSILTNTMATVARERIRTTKILQSVRKYCLTHSIAYSYTLQMRRYVEREHRRKELQSHMPMLQTLPEGMVRELFQEGRSLTLNHHPFLKEVGITDPSFHLNMCNQAIVEDYLLAGDSIFDSSSKTQGMYMISAGSSTYFYWADGQPAIPNRRKGRRDTAGSLFKNLLGGGVPLVKPEDDFGSALTQTQLEVGEYVAEPALWVKAWRHQGQLRAMVESRTLLVSTEELFKVLQGYANAMANTVVYARCFVEELNKTAELSKQVNDLPFVAAEDPEMKKVNSMLSQKSQRGQKGKQVRPF